MTKIYFKGAEEATNLVELFTLGYSLDHGKFVYTYIDKKCTYQQCHEACRSLDDLLDIANTYFPNSTELDVLDAIRKVDKKEFVPLLFDCCTIYKPVIYFHPAIYFEQSTLDYIEVNGFWILEGSKNDKNSVYTRDQIKEMINSLEEVLEHV